MRGRVLLLRAVGGSGVVVGVPGEECGRWRGGALGVARWGYAPLLV